MPLYSTKKNDIENKNYKRCIFLLTAEDIRCIMIIQVIQDIHNV